VNLRSSHAFAKRIPPFFFICSAVALPEARGTSCMLPMHDLEAIGQRLNESESIIVGRVEAMALAVPLDIWSRSSMATVIAEKVFRGDVPRRIEMYIDPDIAVVNAQFSTSAPKTLPRLRPDWRGSRQTHKARRPAQSFRLHRNGAPSQPAPVCMCWWRAIEGARTSQIWRCCRSTVAAELCTFT
jgi:hypothetical protein